MGSTWKIARKLKIFYLDPIEHFLDVTWRGVGQFRASSLTGYRATAYGTVIEEVERLGAINAIGFVGLARPGEIHRTVRHDLEVCDSQMVGIR